MRYQDSTLYRRAIKFLYRRTNYETFKSIPYEQMEKSLVRLKDFLSFLGNPERQYAIVHVAGTKGKGTVCNAVERILRESGHRVGLFTSPHLDDVMERFQINGRNCDKAFFAETLLGLAERWKEFIGKRRREDAFQFDSGEPDDGLEPKLTFFEWTLVVALTLFARAKVDVAVLEVGMGGRFDATNVCDADVSVLTSVSYDHCEQLGSTMLEIASEKLGIVKTNAPLVCGVGFSNFLRHDEYAYEETDELCPENAIRCDNVELGEQVENDHEETTSRRGRGRARKERIEEAFEREKKEQKDRRLHEARLAALDPQTQITEADVVATRNLARKRAEAFGAPFIQVEKWSELVDEFPTPPFDSVLRWNFEIALRVVDVLANRTTAPQGRPGSAEGEIARTFPVTEEAIVRAATNYETPARFEIVSTSPTIVVDGAHNRASVAAFMRSVAELYPDKKIKILFATTIGKDVRGMIAEIGLKADEIVLTERSQETRALPLPDLIQISENVLDEVCPEEAAIRGKFRVAPDFKAFLAEYCTRTNLTNEVLCAIGSFYFAAEVRKMAKGI